MKATMVTGKKSLKKVNGAEIVAKIAFVAKAVSDNPTRHMLTAMHLDIVEMDGVKRGRLAAADGRRLHMAYVDEDFAPDGCYVELVKKTKKTATLAIIEETSAVFPKLGPVIPGADGYRGEIQSMPSVKIEVGEAASLRWYPRMLFALDKDDAPIFNAQYLHDLPEGEYSVTADMDNARNKGWLFTRKIKHTATNANMTPGPDWFETDIQAVIMPMMRD